jgi:hypothetical protein
MPPATEILDGLSVVANRASGIAVTWHVAIAMCLVALAAGWRPSQRTARLLIGMPLASVAGVAIVFNNPFNGLVFGASALALTAIAIGDDRRLVSRGSAWARDIGVTTIAFGWVYPHFLQGDATVSLYAAPVGLVPCPTLAVAIGFALVGNGLGSRVWSLTLATLGLFYGLFGVLRLGVFLDIGLVGAALTLVAVVLQSASSDRAGLAHRPGTRSERAA